MFETQLEWVWIYKVSCGSQLVDWVGVLRCWSETFYFGWFLFAFGRNCI